MAKFLEKRPKTERYFREAYGYVIYPSAGRAGLGFGGAGGKGLVIEQGRIAGISRFGGFTSGVQAGFRSYGMIIIFEEWVDLELFKLGLWEFVGQTDLSAFKAGISGDPAYDGGVAIFTRTRWGLMAEASVGGTKFTFRPLEDTDRGATESPSGSATGP